jgi:ABC-2 type transport system permease protein
MEKNIMDKIYAIFKKEFFGFFANPNYWVVCGLASVIMSWVFPIQLNMFAETLKNQVYSANLPAQQLNIHYAVFLRHLSYLNLILILVVPAFTMRMLAEEKKMKTMDLLLTSPVSSLQIVLGKYFAVLGALFGLVVLALLYPASTALFTKLNWAPLFVSFGGLFFVAAVYAAMNLFCSAMTESAIIAYVMAVIFNISVWFVGIGADVVDSAWARQAFEHISLSVHLSSLVEGTIRTSTLIFFLSLIALFVFLAERVVESARWR